MTARDIRDRCASYETIKTALWDRAHLKIAIGDRWNELGLGYVAAKTRVFGLSAIPNDDKIVCSEEFSADHLIFCRVSN